MRFLICFFLLIATAKADNITSPPPLPEDSPALQHYLRSIYENFHRLPVTTTDPNGVRRGKKGDLVLLDEDGDGDIFHLEINVDSDKEWTAVQLGPSTSSGTPGGSNPQLQYNNNGMFGGVSGSGVDANGNVGIGTSVPNAKLNVVGGFNITSGNVGIGTVFVPGNTSAIVYMQNPTTSINKQTLEVDSNQSGGGTGIIAIGVGSNAVAVDARTTNAAHTNSKGLSALVFKPTDVAVHINSASVGSWGIYQEGSANAHGSYFKDKVGIGTEYPSSALDISGTAKMTGFQLSTNPQSGYVVVGNAVGVGTWMSGTTLPGAFWSRTGSNLYPTTISDNIGIGTSVLNNKFTVYGNVGIGSSDINQAITATGGGSIAFGHSVFQGAGSVTQNNKILASGNGSLAGGIADDVNCSGVYRNTITASGRASTALGFVVSGCGTGGNGSLLSSSDGSVALGFVAANLTNDASLTSSGNGSLAFGAVNSGTILANGHGSLSGGYVSGNVTIPLITSTANGSFAFGNGTGPNSVIRSSNLGSIAMGFANGGTLQSTGEGSIAMGENVQATQNNAITFGKSLINNDASTFQVGFQAGQPTLFADVSNVGIGTRAPIQKIDIRGNQYVSGNIGIGSLSPMQSLVIGTGSLQTVGIGTTVPQLPCIKANRVWGYYDPPWTGVCT